MQTYWLTIDISFSPGLIVLDNDEAPIGGDVVGAIIEIGVTETSEVEARKQAVSCIREISDWDNRQYSTTFDRVGLIEPDDFQAEIYGDNDVCDSLTHNPSKKGIWYRSGFAFYFDGE